jgi:metal-responsive CopG/Arc/MetJ family transcriptional regulator
MRKEKLTVTISGDLVNEIDEIAKKKGTPRSQVMEEMLRDSLQKAKKKAIEKDIEAYYLSLTKKEKKEDKEWVKIATESAKRSWND